MGKTQTFAPDPLNLGMFQGLGEWITDYNEVVCDWCGSLYRERKDIFNCPNCGGPRKKEKHGRHKRHA